AKRWGVAKATSRGWETPGLRAPHGANSTNATIPLAPRGLHAGRSAPRSERPGRSSLLFPPGNTCNTLDRDGRTRSRDGRCSLPPFHMRVGHLVHERGKIAIPLGPNDKMPMVGHNESLIVPTFLRFCSRLA